jgi:hypothetical protein
VALFREVYQALIQILLMVFLTVVGIFAGSVGRNTLGSTSDQ